MSKIKDELFGEMLDIANEIRTENNHDAECIAEEIMSSIDTDQYIDGKTAVIVGVWVRRGNDIMSLGGHYTLKASKGWAMEDIHKFLYNTDETYMSMSREKN